MVLLENITWPKAREQILKCDVAMVPIGSTEQHGLHLPMGTDHFLARFISREVTNRTGILCTPTIPIGISDHHIQFWGTLTVTPDTLRQYMIETCLSLKTHGIHKIIIYNCHGGNQLAMEEAARILRTEHRLPTFVCHVVAASLASYVNELFGHEGAYAGAHCGGAETSLIMAMHEDLVDKVELAKGTRGAEKYGKQVFGTPVAFDVIDFSSNGMIGIPAEGTKERGMKLLNRTIEEMCNFVEWVKKTPLDEMLPKPHIE